jgi:Caspase domain
MKKLTFYLIALFGFTSLQAQTFSEKTPTFSVDLTRPIETNTLPKIKWLVPSLENTGIQEQEATLEALIDSHHTISEIIVTVSNGAQRNVQKLAIGENPYSKNVSLKITLFPGRNKIQLSVLNSKGGKVSGFREIEMGEKALLTNMHANRKDYALIFATDKYDNWPDLQNPVAAAEMLGKLLVSEYGFETEIIRNPSIRDIQRKLAEYEAKEYGSQDQLFIYFAGNCYFDNLMGMGYLVAANSQKTTKTDTYFSQAALRKSLNTFKCPHIFLAVDACCADLADPKAAAIAPTEISDQQGLVDKLNLPSRKFLVGANLEYQANNNVAGQFSELTVALIESLKQSPSARTAKSSSSISSYFKKMDAYLGGFGNDGKNSEFLFIPK